jgi:hypothetical protein
MVKRLYWTETGVSGTSYRLVKDNIAVATTNTTVAGNAVSSSALPSIDWPQPPTSMRGLCLHPGGFMVGFSGNTLYFSPPFVPYAYPLAYQVAVGFDIVGVKVVGTTIVVGTKGNPYTYTGPAPDALAAARWSRLGRASRRPACSTWASASPTRRRRGSRSSGPASPISSPPISTPSRNGRRSIRRRSSRRSTPAATW